MTEASITVSDAVADSSYSFDQLLIKRLIDFSTQSTNVDINDVAVTLPLKRPRQFQRSTIAA